jgi:hypothetical protein
MSIFRSIMEVVPIFFLEKPRNPVGKKPGFEKLGKNSETRLGKNRVSRGWGKTQKPGWGKTGFLERYPQKPGWQKTGFREVGEKPRNPVGEKPGFDVPQKPGWQKTGFREVGEKPGFERLGKNSETRLAKNRVSRSWGKTGFLN